MSNTITLAEIQAKVKAPKKQFNKFGNYAYRSAEDIVEAAKLILNPEGFWLIVSDEMVEVGGRVYCKATAVISNGKQTYQAVGYAREEESKKGMDASQLTGSTSSYSRKYALNGLFALDDTKDADATNTHDKAPAEPKIEKSVIEEWRTMLKSVDKLEELIKIYKENQTFVNDNVEIKKQFSERKKQLEDQLKAQ
jgi:hypothetical protein